MKRNINWKDIEGYEGLYQINGFGNIKSLYFKKNLAKEKMLKKYLNNKGYEFICLYKNKIKKQFLVHRLVVQSFISNINNLEVNHKNGIKTDNRVENLELCSRSYNNKEAYRMGLKKPTYNQNLNKKKVILKIDPIKNTVIEKCLGIKKTAKTLGVSKSALIDSLQGRIKTCGGFKWVYKDRWVGGE